MSAGRAAAVGYRSCLRRFRPAHGAVAANSTARATCIRKRRAGGYGVADTFAVVCLPCALRASRPQTTRTLVTSTHGNRRPRHHLTGRGACPDPLPSAADKTGYQCRMTGAGGGGGTIPPASGMPSEGCPPPDRQVSRPTGHLRRYAGARTGAHGEHRHKQTVPSRQLSGRPARGIYGAAAAPAGQIWRTRAVNQRAPRGVALRPGGGAPRMGWGALRSGCSAWLDTECVQCAGG